MNEHLSMLLNLGPNAEWPYTEKAMIELINLQREKEITKQMYYRTENLNKSIELLNNCVGSNIPSCLIPLIFSGENLSQELMEKIVEDQHQQREDKPKQSIPSVKIDPDSSSSLSNDSHANTPNASNMPHGSLRPAVPQHQPHSKQPSQHPFLAPPASLYRTRPLSPAKIGAAAVNQLDRGRYPSSPVHRRNMSVPVTSSFNAPIASTFTHPNSRQSKSPMNSISLNCGDQKSMMNTIGSIQFVKENPGKKRRRSSQGHKRDQDGDDGVDDDDKSTSNGVRKEVNNTKKESNPARITV